MVCNWMTGVVIGNHGVYLNDWCGYWYGVYLNDWCGYW